MKVMTVLGTRPEIIRLSLIIGKLDTYCEHILVHTGQNYDDNLSQIFFSDLEIRQADHYLGVRQVSFGQQIGRILIEAERVILREQPDAILILGDTNSGLVSIVANRMGIPVFHMEAGNRCYDDRVPEEVNRRIIDHTSTILMPYTHRSKENLLREGISRDRIYVIGNPIFEVIQAYERQIENSEIFERLQVEPQKYFLMTMHRQENVDVRFRLKSLLQVIDDLQKEHRMPVVCSLHPRTKSKMQQFSIDVRNDDVHFLEPLGFFDFVALEQKAYCVLTDSGTVQEECCIFGVPNITIRDVTERPETVEHGSNIITGINPETIVKCVEIVLKENRDWKVPDEYIVNNVSSTVIRIVMGYGRHSKSIGHNELESF